MLSGGQNRERPSGVICGTPIRSSGASWVPSSETHSRPSESANWLTSEDLPMPGAPHRNTGRTVASPSSSSGTWDGDTVTADCTSLLGEGWWWGSAVSVNRRDGPAHPVFHRFAELSTGWGQRARNDSAVAMSDNFQLHG